MKKKAPRPPEILRKGGPQVNKKKEQKKKGDPLPHSIMKFLTF